MNSLLDLTDPESDPPISSCEPQVPSRSSSSSSPSSSSLSLPSWTADFNTSTPMERSSSNLAQSESFGESTPQEEEEASSSLECEPRTSADKASSKGSRSSSSQSQMCRREKFKIFVMTHWRKIVLFSVLGVIVGTLAIYLMHYGYIGKALISTLKFTKSLGGWVRVC